MMKKITIAILMCASLFVNAQQNSGIVFEQGLTLEQIKEKARKENKYLFVDCYATWCKPCKEMDKYIYPNDTVGAYLNSRFISIKVQLDSTKNDGDNIKVLYPAARELEKKYKVTVLPTLLFFSPSGELVHKGVGGQSVQEFLALANESTNSDRQLYSLVRKWQLSQLAYGAIPEVITKLAFIGEDSIAKIIAKDYIDNYLNKMYDAQFFTKENLRFMSKFITFITTKERVFKLYLNQADKVDSIMNTKGYAKERAGYIIAKEELAPLLAKAEKVNRTPSWLKIERKIARKYNKKLAFTTVVKAKMDWYYNKKERSKYLTALMDKWNKDSSDFSKYGWMTLNSLAWRVCVYSNDTGELVNALKWINMGLTKDELSNEAMLDTKACILYKMKQTEEALLLESQVVEILKRKAEITKNENTKKLYLDGASYHQEIMKKMRNGEQLELID